MSMKTVVLVLLAAVVLSTACIAGSTQYNWQWGRDFSKCTFSHAGYVKHLGYVVYDPKIPAQQGDEDGVGVIETQMVVPPEPFDMAIPSWNVNAPSGSYVVLLFKARVNGVWSKWCKLTVYDTDGKPGPKTSCEDGDDIIYSNTSAVSIRKGNADAIRMRIELRSTDGKTYPSLRYMSICAVASGPKDRRPDVAPLKSVWGTELDVPYLCQLSVPGGNVWCSPTSTAMVLGYWGKKLNRPELSVGITEAATAIRDASFGGTGNWGMNTAFAGEFKGITAYVSRFMSVADIEKCIAKGVPVIVGLDYNRLNRRNRKDSMGHLMVIRGFTKDGDPVFNDPWAHVDRGEKLRKVFKRADLEYAWLGDGSSGGTVYIIRPERMKL